MALFKAMSEPSDPSNPTSIFFIVTISFSKQDRSACPESQNQYYLIPF